ncbi:MAG: hypothetical protein LBI18_05670 [Planctomycetaceae bacterium]|jgi:hypothetical protein|nr:hypothetical protein [Planctomycetaceae bacterium]
MFSQNFYIRFLFLLFGVIVFSGCGNYLAVKGKVVFEDGTPLECGTIIFQSESHYARGTIRTGGNFVIGSDKEQDGVPSGHYKVFITGAQTIQPDFVPKPGKDDVGYVSLIDPIYSSVETTPIMYDIDKNNYFEIKVKPFINSAKAQ